MRKPIFKAVICCLISLCILFQAISFALADGIVCDCDKSLSVRPIANIVSKSLRSTAVGIVKSVSRPGMSDYDLALALNDWLMEHTRYKAHATSAYDVLKNGLASCSGYANAYCALLDAAELGNKRIAGKSFRFAHVWNLVKMDGKWYHVDVRMNDSSDSHLYFGLTHDAISVNHQGFGRGTECNSYECNYEYRNGIYDSAISYISSAIKENFQNGVSAFMVSLKTPNCPSVLNNPIQRAMIMRVIDSSGYDFLDDEIDITYSVLPEAIAIYIEKPNIKISKVTLSREKAKITVSDIDIEKPTYQLTAEVTPSNATNPHVFWKSRNESIATVDQNGLVTFHKYGKVKIQAMAEDGSREKAGCEFTVKKKQNSVK